MSIAEDNLNPYTKRIVAYFVEHFDAFSRSDEAQRLLRLEIAKAFVRADRNPAADPALANEIEKLPWEQMKALLSSKLPTLALALQEKWNPPLREPRA